MPTLLAIDDSPKRTADDPGDIRERRFEIIEAADGLEALQKAASTPVDIVVTDLNMPRMNGLAFIRHLRALPSYHGLPIIVLTTESDQGSRKEASAAGASAWITKPFNAQALLDIATGFLK